MAGSLFAAPGTPNHWRQTVSWWEWRRIPFNVIIGVYGCTCLLIFMWGLSASGHLRPGDDAVEPLALLAAPFVINALYTLGWIIEVPARLLAPGLSPDFGPLLFEIGLATGLILITVPAAFWGGYRVLQLAGLVG